LATSPTYLQLQDDLGVDDYQLKDLSNFSDKPLIDRKNNITLDLSQFCNILYRFVTFMTEILSRQLGGYGIL